jgi:hypothetical protein
MRNIKKRIIHPTMILLENNSVLLINSKEDS